MDGETRWSARCSMDLSLLGMDEHPSQHPPPPGGNAPKVRACGQPGASMARRCASSPETRHAKFAMLFFRMRDIPRLKAEFFKALGHPVRIRVLELLSER